MDEWEGVGQNPLVWNVTAIGQDDTCSVSLVVVTGRLYRPVQVKHPRCARFSLQNEQGLFFIKVYQAALVELARSLPPHTTLAVIGELGSFVSRRCQNHHVCIKAVALFPLAGAVENWVVKIEKQSG